MSPESLYLSKKRKIESKINNEWYPDDIPMISRWYPDDIPMISRWYRILNHNIKRRDERGTVGSLSKKRKMKSKKNGNQVFPLTPVKPNNSLYGSHVNLGFISELLNREGLTGNRGYLVTCQTVRWHIKEGREGLKGNRGSPEWIELFFLKR